MNILIAGTTASLSGNGDTIGYVTVVDNTPFYPGTTCWISGNTAPKAFCMITEISGLDKIRLRVLPLQEIPGVIKTRPVYGNSDMSAYTVVDGAKIDLPSQLAPVASLYPLVKIPRA